MNTKKPVGPTQVQLKKNDHDLFLKSLVILCSSVMWGYVCILAIWISSRELVVIPLMTKNAGMIFISYLAGFNLFLSAIGFGISQKPKNTNRLKYALYAIGFTAIVSIYILTKFSGGFYWSPFTGYYSLIITTLSLCMRVWKEKFEKTLVPIVGVGVALTLVIGFSAWTDQIELQTIEKIHFDRDLKELGQQEKKQIIKTIKKLNEENFKKDIVNWKLELLDYYDIWSKYLPNKKNGKSLVLTGILSVKKEDAIIEKISIDIKGINGNIGPNNRSLDFLYSKIRSVGDQSRYFVKFQSNYKAIFILVIIASVLFSLIVLIYHPLKLKLIKLKHYFHTLLFKLKNSRQ